MNVVEALERMNEKISGACRRSGRNPGDIRIMGVTKFHGRDVLQAAWDAGIRLFGENRVQEAAEKFPPFMEGHPGAELHMIGSLQRNKVKKALSLFSCIQSVDRLELIDELGKAAEGRASPLDILLELHTGEESKAGFPDIDALCMATDRALPHKGLRIRGLMTMAPFTDDRQRIRASFKSLVSAGDTLGKKYPECDWSCLSMGMSNDYEIAVEEGSTMVRIGSALFGTRS